MRRWSITQRTFRTSPPRTASKRCGFALALAGLLSGCAHGSSAPDRRTVYGNLESRTGLATPPAIDADSRLPYGIRLTDELGENEAVLLALWQNAAFQEALTDLGIARGDLIQAGLLPNPEIVYLFGMPDKPFRYLAEVPLEALWLRPIRKAAASRETHRVAERLTQLGLDLIRDTRQAYADAVLARGRLRIGEDAIKVRGEVARLAEVRLKAGDASVQEAATARIDADQALQDLSRLRYDVRIADERLRQLLGLGECPDPLRLDATPPPERHDLQREPLVKEATESRPDALAAEQSLAAANERLRLAKIGWVRFLGIADATSGTRTGHELGPGVRMTLPILNWNQGSIARAQAEAEKADRLRKTVHDQIVADVNIAHHRYAQARDELQVLDQRVRPEVELAIRRAEAAYKEGNTPYVVVLETTRQYLDTRIRREQLLAELRRAWADLERGVGRRLSPNDSAACPVALLFQEEGSAR